MSSSAKKIILVIDDEQDVRKYLTMALEDAGFNVVTACNGFEGMDKVKEKTPDLISLDLVMPKRSGAKFYRDLMKNKQFSKIPIIIVTGHARDEFGKADLKELTMSGPGIYLEKPVKPDNYIAAVKKLIGMDASEDEKEIADKVTLQSSLKNIIDDADSDMLKKLKELLDKME